jgi:uncharacterized membrane protein YcaP (DUF421 family)
MQLPSANAMLEDLFYSGLRPLIHTLVVALIAYPTMLLLVRVSGHRTLSKMNAFDLVVTVALGSTLATAIVSSDVALAQGLLAFLLLVAMQYALAWLARRSSRLESLLNGDPVLVFHSGEFLRGAMRHTRLTESEILASMREQGVADLDDVESVVLETNGRLSVIPAQGERRAGARVGAA